MTWAALAERAALAVAGWAIDRLRDPAAEHEVAARRHVREAIEARRAQLRRRRARP